MIELDPNTVSAHYIESQETGTEQIIEPISVHKAAPIEEVKVKFAECIPLKWVRYPQKCFKVEDIKKQKPKIVHEGFKNNLLHNYAYELGGIDFVLTLNSENGRWDHNVKSPVNGNGYRDVGLCQLNLAWHSKFYSSKDYQNPYIQLRYCYDVYQEAINNGRIRTTFYGFNVRHQRNTKADGSKRIYEL